MGLSFRAYIQPSSITFTTTYAKLSGLGYTPASYVSSIDYTKLSTGQAYSAIHYLLSTNHAYVATTTFSISHDRKFLNLATIYINGAKYSGRNDSFIFKLVIL